MIPEQNPQAAGDLITVLTSAGPRLTKVWDSATGKPQAYERAQQVSVQERHVANIRELGVLLDELEGERNSCIIRGKFIGHAKARELYPEEVERDRKRGKTLAIPKDGFTLRRKTFFKDRPLHFFYIDIDKFQPEGIDPVLEPELAIEQYIAKHLPACFQGVTYHWQLSAGAGHPDNVGVLKAHVAFWLSKPTLGDDLEAWVKAKNLPIDVTVFRTVQPNYTAAPMFINGVVDPVPRRSGLFEGWASDEVDLEIDPTIIVRARAERKERAEMVDPREKDNDIGLFCRTFEIEEVVERFLPEVFEFVTDTRVTWLLSDSGAAEGAGVTDNRQGIFNTHNGDPFQGRAANKWDLVRHYKFGHLDEGLDEFELLNISDRPSQVAMKEFVKTLPEMQTEVVDAAATHRSAIEAAPDEAAVRDVAQRIALDGSLDRLARDMLAGALQARLRQLTGVKPSIQAVRALVTMSRGRAPTQAAGGPSWIEPWCYVTAQARFFNRVTKEVVTREAFDAAHTRHMPLNAEGQRPSAAKVACEEWGLPTVYNLMYLPSAGDMFNMDGLEYANLYRPDSVPTAVIDAAANAVLMRHVELLIPEPVYRELFLQFAAWVVRNPGHKVLWALLIKGVEGDGKSVLGSMIAQAMGHENVGIISPETLAGSNFNDWAVGRCVNVLEELKMQGHNRHDVYNKIKPLITNPRIEVHGKGKASMTAVNTTNYIGFTNHDDALPLDDMDRRHFVLFTPWRAIGEMHAAVAALGLTMDQYWEQLWDVVKNRPDVVRGFFEAVDISTFNPNSRAPATVFKQAVVAAGDLDDAEGFARFWIEEGCHGVSSQIVSSACLTKALADMDPPVQIHTTRVRKLLKSMGFEQVPGFLKWKGAAHRVWVRVTGPGVTSLGVGASTAELRAALDKTTGSVVEDFLQ